jgi:hypothetical protein
VPIIPLTLTDALPLPQEFDSLIISGAAIRLTALDNIEPTKGTMFISERLLKRCKQRYSQHANTSYGGQYLETSLQAFDSGGSTPW